MVGGGGCLCKMLGLSAKFILKKPNAVFTSAWVIQGRACRQLNEHLAEELTPKGTFSWAPGDKQECRKRWLALSAASEHRASGRWGWEARIREVNNPTGQMDLLRLRCFLMALSSNCRRCESGVVG